MTLELVYSAKCFDGEQRFYSHYSDTVKCKMNLGIYLPPKAIKENTECPVLYFLNGRKASHEDFIRKTAFQRFASKFNIIVVSPDTSPRNVDVPSHDYLGAGASFYVDAVQEPWAKHYQMYSYVTKELIELINKNLPVIKNKQSISGHSMGGYGALICALKNPGLYQSVSTFAPACNPMESGVGRKVFEAYIGNDKELWKTWDPCALAENFTGNPMEVLIYQGSRDNYLLGKHLLPQNFISAAEKNDRVHVIYKEKDGYDHGHYFVATFVDEHMEYHAKFLNPNSTTL